MKMSMQSVIAWTANSELVDDLFNAAVPYLWQYTCNYLNFAEKQKQMIAHTTIFRNKWVE